jgi:hypothetical protein
LLATSPRKRGEVNRRLSSRSQRRRETFEIAVAWRQAEAQEIVGPLETSAPDVLARK